MDTGSQADFGRAAADYAAFRPDYPPAFYARVVARGWAAPGQRVLDLGTGTGLLARGWARRGLVATGIDPSRAMLAEAMRSDREAGLGVVHVVGRAESTGLPARSFELVTAGQCWHWFRGAEAAREARRVLVPGGRLLIAHYDWLPLPGSVAGVTDALIRDWNPRWTLWGGDGLYPQWSDDLAAADARDVESFWFDVAQTFTHETWRGRIRSSAGVGASMKPDVVRRFENDLTEVLETQFPEEVLVVPHRVFVLTGTM